MNPRLAVLAVLLTTFVFTLTGVGVGYLVSSASSVQAGAMGPTQASTMVFMSYAVFTAGGVIVGLGLSLFAIWLTGPLKRD